MFHLLLYGLLSNERASLRTLEGDFNSTKFKFFFNVPTDVNTKYNSLSERLSLNTASLMLQKIDKICKSESSFF